MPVSLSNGAWLMPENTQQEKLTILGWGRKHLNYLHLVHMTDPTSTEAKCVIHFNRATQKHRLQTGSSKYKRTKSRKAGGWSSQARNRW